MVTSTIWCLADSSHQNPGSIFWGQKIRGFLCQVGSGLASSLRGKLGDTTDGLMEGLLTEGEAPPRGQLRGGPRRCWDFDGKSYWFTGEAFFVGKEWRDH